MSKHEYRVSEAKRQERLKQISQEQSHDLSGELAIARLMLEEAVQAGNTGLAASLMEVVRRLSVDDLDRAKRERDLLDRHTIQQLGWAMGDALYEVLTGYLDDADCADVIEAWGQRCRALMTNHKETGELPPPSEDAQ